MCSERDKNVLNIILNPNLPFDANQEGEEGSKAEDDDYSKLPNCRECEVENLEGVKLAEKGDFDAALAKFNKAIQFCPGHPSPYNNRAQLHRLMAKMDEALADLEKSLELSEGKGRIAAQSFVQMALINRLQGGEQLARAQLEKAAALGSTFAKNQLVEMNPYAAMCNKMLGEIMTKFRKGDEEEEEEE